MYNISIIQGTVRTGRQSINVSNYLESLINKRFSDKLSATVIDPRDYDLSDDGNGEDAVDQKYIEAISKSDGFIIVVPEYNHSFPSSLKRILDMDFKNYIHKPVVLAGVSGGPWGGIRAIQSLVPVAREIGMIVSFADLQFPHVQDLFDDSGEMKSEHKEKFGPRVDKSVTELLWLTETMSYGIKNLDNKYH